MNNTSNPANDTDTHQDTGLGANAMISIYSIVLILSLIGNVLVIAVVCGNKNLRTFFNSFIVNMAISDLFIPLLALPIKIVEVATEKKSIWLIESAAGNVTCKLFMFLTDISPAVTVFSLVIIAFNRFVAIVKPMYHAELFSPKRCKILIAFTWIAAGIVFSLHFHTYRTAYDGNNKCQYEFSAPFDQKSEVAFFLLIFAVFFAVPFATIIILYSVIIYKLHQDSKTVAQMLGDEGTRKRKQRNKHIFFISVAMIVAFAVFWGPFFVVLFMTIATQKSFSNTLFLVVQLLGYINSVINPCIYFVFLETFRTGFKRLFCGCLEKNDDGSPTQETRSVIFTKDNANDENTKIRLAKTTGTQL